MSNNAMKNENMLCIGNKRFWCGAVDLNTGNILEVHTIQEADEADYHTDFYFSYDVSVKLNNNEAVFFWYKGGKILLDDEAMLTQKRKTMIMQKLYSEVNIVQVVKNEMTIRALAKASDRELITLLRLTEDAIKSRKKVTEGALWVLLSLNQLTASEVKPLVHNEIVKRWLKLNGVTGRN